MFQKLIYEIHDKLKNSKGHSWSEDPLLHGQEETHVKTSQYIKEYSVRSLLTKDR